MKDKWNMELFHILMHNYHQLFGEHVVFSVGILLMAGYFFGKLAEVFKLPSITGYIVAGLLLGESVLEIIPETMAYRLTSITEIALGLIALTIGGEFQLSKIKRIGTKIFILTVFEALFAFIIVTISLTIIGMGFKYSLLLGAIATATAPAATVVVIRQLRARGEFIDYLYGVVAFDDAICVIIFSIVFAVVGPTLAHNSTVSHGALLSFFHAITEIGLSILLGVIAGFILHFFTRKMYKLNEVLIVSVAMIFLTTSTAIALHLSLLIANMVFGAVLVNLSGKNRRIFRVLEPVTPPIFALFFILAGTELHINVFSKFIVIIYGLMYIISRFGGKFLGIIVGSFLIKAPDNIRKYLGFCLFPQAGVAIGLVLLVQTSPIMATAPEIVRSMLVLIVNIILISIFINELVGPAITKYGIVKGADL